jgi:hypothetical protein
MIRPMKLTFLLFALPLLAADPAGFNMWTAAEVKSKIAAAKLDEHKVGLDRAATWGNHGLLLIRREGDGEAEVHERWHRGMCSIFRRSCRIRCWCRNR